jgi:archaellin
MNFIDAQARTADVTYTVTEIQGDGDNLLENGELMEINVTPGGTLDVNEIFTIEVVPPQGGTLLINRTMPPEVDVVMDLH